MNRHGAQVVQDEPVLARGPRCGSLLFEVMRDNMERAPHSQEHARSTLAADTVPRVQLQVLIRQHPEMAWSRTPISPQ